MCNLLIIFGLKIFKFSMKKNGFLLPLPNGSSFLMLFIKSIFKAVDDIFEIYFFWFLIDKIVSEFI